MLPVDADTLGFRPPFLLCQPNRNSLMMLLIASHLQSNFNEFHDVHAGAALPPQLLPRAPAFGCRVEWSVRLAARAVCAVICCNQVPRHLLRVAGFEALNALVFIGDCDCLYSGPFSCDDVATLK